MCFTLSNTPISRPLTDTYAHATLPPFLHETLTLNLPPAAPVNPISSWVSLCIRYATPDLYRIRSLTLVDSVMATEKGEIEAPVAIKPGDEAGPCHGPTLAEVHVLAVDDSVLDRTVIERLLRTSSYKVTTVDSGKKALEFLGIEGGLGLQVNISLIITDYCMPGMTGYDLLRRVKESSAFKETPVVIMSSENVPNRIQRCLEEGAEEFIMKPVKMADVQRLKLHICASQSTCQVDQPGELCSKRKFLSEGFGMQNPRRRQRLSELAVA